MAKRNGSGKVGISLSRRDFLKGVGSGVILTGVLSPGAALEVQSQEAIPTGKKVPVKLEVNGKTHTLQLEPRVTLLDALRNHLDLTGTKKICDRGECGGCTVLLQRPGDKIPKPIYSCMMLAVDAQGANVITVEGLAKDGKLHPVQEAFIEKDALMCGFCTPGLVMSVAALLMKNPNPTLEDVKVGVSGNLCRCGTYPRVFEAALAAAAKMKGTG